MKEEGLNGGLNSLKRGERLNMAGTAVLIVLMLIYLTMNINSSSKMARQLDIIAEHPFEVVISAGDVKLYISEMSMRTERLQRHNNSEDVQIAVKELKALYEELEEPLNRVADLYLGDSEDVRELRETLSYLVTEQDDFLEYVSNAELPEEVVAEYAQEHLQPLYDRAMRETDRIITVAQSRKVEYGRQMDSLRQTTLIGSVSLMALMIGLLLLLQYILLRQRKELAYRSRLIDNLSLSIDDAFVIHDAVSGKVRYCALNMERVMGYSQKDVEKVYERIPVEDREELSAVIRDPSRSSTFEKIMRYTRPNGEKRWILLRVYRPANLEIPQVIIVLSDRTEEVLSRQALQDAMLTAERANTAKSDFLSRMSHEIRTPLNAIIGMTDIAAANVNNTGRLEDCLTKIQFSSKHLLMLINDILDMSKIESNKMSLQSEPFDIFQVINGFVSTVYAQAKDKDIDFSESMEGFGEHTEFVGDSLRLNQILLNLSSNAVKFTEPGGKIRLKVTKLASKNAVDIIRFALSDTGIGMSQEAIERIFKPFEQADASIAGRFGGTGLGMSITQNLVMLMNGKIHVKSTPGEGTTFTVDIPFQRAEENLSEPDFQDYGLCALIVDDERQVCEQVAVLLEKMKIKAEWRLSGAEAMERVKEKHRESRDFDLCLVDWKMPGMDGIELTRRIRREISEDIPVVIISAYDITQVELEAKYAGVNGFLPKPLYRSSMYSAIKEAIEGRLEEPAGDAAGAGERQEGPEDRKQPLKGRHLLIAEDNVLNMEIAQELLRMNGAEISYAANGREVLDMFLASKPGDFDAVLMDVQMPVMDGHEATRRIRASGHPEADLIPIIATTANAFSDDISAALAAGMDSHISKPLDIGQLCAVLLDCMKKAEEKRRAKGAV